MSALRVRVPASSANLGPGFDALGMALSLHLEMGIDDGSPLPEFAKVIDDSHPSLAAFRHAGGTGNVWVRSVIPMGRGLGFSGAARVAGVVLGHAQSNGKESLIRDRRELLRLSTELEGHPDNVAPALFGGLTIAWVDEAGPHHKKLTVHRGISPLVLVAPNEMSTKLARSLQPESVPHTDAVFNVSRSALLVAALTQSPELMMAATEDRLHQNYRASAMPETSKLISNLREKGHPAVVSGAGPSVLVLEGDPQNRLLAMEYVKKEFSPWQALALAVDFKGASLEGQSGSGS